jgi:hypothetical protein
MGRTISKGDTATMLEPYAGLEPGAAVIVALKDDFGVWVTQSEQMITDMDLQFIGKSKAVELARKQYIEANMKFVPESALTKQRVQFKHAVISAESAEDIGRKIKQDIVSIVRANETDHWSMNSGVRFPNEKCPTCPMRGICADSPELRDMLLVRKQLDEFDFGKESE